MEIRDSEGIQRADTNGVRLKWTWPAVRFTDTCVVGVCREKPKAANRPDDDVVLYRREWDRQRYEANSDGVRLKVEPDWQGAHVVVWAVVDLGFQVFHSQPLDLGQIAPAKEKEKWAIFRTAKRAKL